MIFLDDFLGDISISLDPTPLNPYKGHKFSLFFMNISLEPVLRQ